jgi:hypothetical protein
MGPQISAWLLPFDYRRLQGWARCLLSQGESSCPKHNEPSDIFPTGGDGSYDVTAYRPLSGLKALN